MTLQRENNHTFAHRFPEGSHRRRFCNKIWPIRKPLTKRSQPPLVLEYSNLEQSRNSSKTMPVPGNGVSRSSEHHYLKAYKWTKKLGPSWLDERSLNQSSSIRKLPNSTVAYSISEDSSSHDARNEASVFDDSSQSSQREANCFHGLERSLDPNNGSVAHATIKKKKKELIGKKDDINKSDNPTTVFNHDVEEIDLRANNTKTHKVLIGAMLRLSTRSKTKKEVQSPKGSVYKLLKQKACEGGLDGAAVENDLQNFGIFFCPAYNGHVESQTLSQEQFKPPPDSRTAVELIIKRADISIGRGDTNSSTCSVSSSSSLASEVLSLKDLREISHIVSVGSDSNTNGIGISMDDCESSTTMTDPWGPDPDVLQTYRDSQNLEGYNCKPQKVLGEESGITNVSSKIDPLVYQSLAPKPVEKVQDRDRENEIPDFDGEAQVLSNFELAMNDLKDLIDKDMKSSLSLDVSYVYQDLNELVDLCAKEQKLSLDSSKKGSEKIERATEDKLVKRREIGFYLMELFEENDLEATKRSVPISD